MRLLHCTLVPLAYSAFATALGQGHAIKMTHLFSCASAAGAQRSGNSQFMRSRPVPEQEATGKRIVASLVRGRMAPMEMQQIALHPCTDPESHFHLRSIVRQRPRANFDGLGDESNSPHLQQPSPQRRSLEGAVELESPRNSGP